jgi:penicillin-binding protein 1A
MYTMFPGRGFNIKPQFITRIEDRNGNVIASNAPQIKEVISEVTAFTMAKMMMGAIQFGTATRLKSYGLTVETSAKTGTTNDNTDAWFMAYTPELLCGSWVGCDENWIHFPSSSGAGYGGAAALPMVGGFLKGVYSSKKLSYNPEAKFVQPPVDKNDIIYDYIQNISVGKSSSAENNLIGAGTEEQYLDDIYNEEVYENNGEIEESEKPITKKQLDSLNQQKIKDSMLKANQQPKAVLPQPEEKKTKRELRKEARQQKNDGKTTEN